LRRAEQHAHDERENDDSESYVEALPHGRTKRDGGELTPTAATPTPAGLPHET